MDHSERPADSLDERVPPALPVCTIWTVVVGLLVVLVAGCSSGSGDSTLGDATNSSVSSTTQAEPKSVTIDPTSPYYVAAKALEEKQVQAGTTVGDCTINAYTKCAGADLAGKNLQGGFLAYSDLSGADLTGVNLLQADVTYSNLDDANLSDAQINATSTTSATFRNAHMPDSQWVLVAGADTDFTGADLKGADFTSAQLTSSKMNGADLTGANFALADLTGVDLDGADLDGANFCQTTMPDGTVRNAQPSDSEAIDRCGARSAPDDAKPLEIDDSNPYFALALTYDKPFVKSKEVVAGCVLEPHSDCTNADIGGQAIQGAIMPYSRIGKADFSGSDMSNVVLDLADGQGAVLKEISFVGGSMAFAQLQDVDLSGATLTFSSLNGANLRGANLSEADLRFGSIVGADLTGADLSKVELPDSNANGTDFTNADLSGANLTNADLTGATLDGAELDGAIFCNTLMPDAKVRNPVDGECPHQ